MAIEPRTTPDPDALALAIADLRATRAIQETLVAEAAAASDAVLLAVMLPSLEMVPSARS